MFGTAKYGSSSGDGRFPYRLTRQPHQVVMLGVMGLCLAAVCQVLAQDIRSQTTGEEGVRQTLSSALQSMETHDYVLALSLSEAALKSCRDFPRAEEYRILFISISADCLRYMGRFEEALAIYGEGLTMLKRLPDFKDQVSACSYNIGYCLEQMGRFEEALEKYEETLGLLETASGTERWLQCAEGIATCLENLDRWPEALTKYEEYLNTLKAMPGSDLNDYARMTVNVSNCLTFIGRFEEALVRYKEALAIYMKLSDKEWQGKCIFNIGLCMKLMGHFVEAITEYEKSVRIFSELLGTERLQSDCLHNAGNCLLSICHFKEALAKYKQSLDLIKSLSNTENEQAKTLNNMGSVLICMGLYDEALEKYGETLTVVKDMPGTDLRKHEALDGMSCCLLAMDRTQEALAKARQSLELLEDLPDNVLNRAARARSMTRIADCLTHNGGYEESLKNFDEALNLWKTILGCGREILQCQGDMGRSLASLGRLDDACRCFHVAYRDNWEYLVPNLPMLDEMEKEFFVGSLLGMPDLLFSVSFQQGGDSSLNSSLGLDGALMSKGLVEWAMQQEQAVFLKQAPEDWRQDYEELQQWRREHAALAHTLTSSLHMQSELESPEARKGWEDRLRTLEERIAAREQELARRNAPLAAEMRLTAIDTLAVSHALTTLGDNTCLLEYVKYHEADFTSGTLNAARYGVYLLRSGSEEPVGIDLGPAQVIDEAIATFRGAIDAMPSFLEKNKKYPDRVQSQHMTAQHAKAGQTLRALIFDPVLPYVGPGTQLFVAPDAELFRLPFEALPSPVEAASGGRYLVEDYGFVYLNSGRELLRFVDRPLVGTSNNTAVIVSNPDVRMPDTERAAQLVRLLDASPHGDREITLAQRPPNPEALLPGILGGAVLGSNTDVTLGVLLDGLDMISGADTFTEELFEFLEQSRRFDSVTVVQRKEALEECVQSLDGPRLLQILSHGVFLPMTERVAEGDSLLISTDASGHREIENPLLRSMLALAGASVSTSSHIYRLSERHFTEEEWLALDASEREGDYTVIPLNDGRLTAYEVTGLPLYNTELVALTACSTALGDVGAGASVAGLRRAFTAAGAHSMIMAQWEVPVGPSMDQMKYFYEAWLGGGQGRYEAFRKSQLQTLADARKIKEVAGHPWFWAGFTYIGDPGLPAIVTTGSE